MSYILDALKKSERERRQSSRPGPPTIDDDISFKQAKRSRWPYLIIAGLALSAGIFVSWAGMFYLKKPVMTLKLASSKPYELNKQNTAPLAPAVKGEGGTSTEENREQRTTPRSDTGSSKGNESMQQKRSVRADAEPQKKNRDPGKHELETRGAHEDPSVVNKTAGAEYASAGPKPENDAAVPSPIPNKIYNLGELPLSIRQVLPAFSVSVFLYSDEPASRMVKIDGRMVKEGQYLAEGLRLEEILPSGLIFSYRNYRFHMDLK